jgi:hypothetical protein
MPTDTACRQGRVAVCFALTLVLVVAAAPPGHVHAQERAQAKSLTNDDVVRMVQAKLGDSVIISEIKHSTCNFDTSPGALIKLKQAGVSDRVLEAMTAAEHAGNRPTGKMSSASSLPAAYGFYIVGVHGLRDLELVNVTTKIGLFAGATIGGTAGYAVDGLRGNAPLIVHDLKPSIIVYQQNIDIAAFRLSELTYVRTMKAYEFNMLGTQPAFFRNVYGRGYYDTVQVDLWRPRGQVPIRVEPVEGHSGMYRLIPNSALQPGRYSLYKFGAVHDANLVFASLRGRSSQAFYFTVEGSTSPEAKSYASPQPDCGDYSTCLQKGDAAFHAHNWPLAVADFKTASGMDSAKPEVWAKLGLAELPSSRGGELTSTWDNALGRGGTVAFPVWHYSTFHFKKGLFRMSNGSVTFTDANGETVFSVSPPQISSLQAHHPPLGGDAWSFGMKVGGHRYWFTFQPLGVECTSPIRCSNPTGYVQEAVVADYVVQAIQRLAAGTLTPPQPPAQAELAPSLTPLAPPPSSTSSSSCGEGISACTGESTSTVTREFLGYCPGEGGCIFGKWTAKDRVAVYANRSTSSPVVFEVEKGDAVDGLRAILDVNRMGEAVVTHDIVNPKSGVTFRAGQTVKIYFYPGEGCSMVEVSGAPMELCVAESLRQVTAPKITLWLQVKNSAGAIGWTNQRGMFIGTSQYD